MFGGEIGIEKILLILIVVLLLFGAKRIPEIGSSLGRGIREFKRSISDLQNEARSEIGVASHDARPSVPRADAAPVPRDDEARPEPKRLIS
jgi:sec-independent protein translocase protein TatA